MRIDAGTQLESLIELVSGCAERALELHRQHQAGGIEVALKGPFDPVTAADREIDARICEALRQEYPEAAIVAEESVPEPEALREGLKRPLVFFVDPIDGTREFIRGSNEWAVMLGVAQAGQAVAGVIALPCDGILFAGRVGQRAFYQRGQERGFVSMSTVKSFAEARLVVSRSHAPGIVGPLQRRLGVRQRVACGSVGAKVARLLLGQADLYVHKGTGVKRWDSCAAEAILAAAGGRLSDLDGRPIDYRAADLALRRGLVATNGLLHPGVLSACPWAEGEADRLAAVAKADA